MTTNIMRAEPRSDNPCPFTTALAAYRAAQQRVDRRATRLTRQAYGASIKRLVATPTPTIAALAHKLAASDPFGLDHHAAILADARRLAGL
jgi:hypothetical protein